MKNLTDEQKMKFCVKLYKDMYYLIQKETELYNEYKEKDMVYTDDLYSLTLSIMRKLIGYCEISEHMPFAFYADYDVEYFKSIIEDAINENNKFYQA